MQFGPETTFIITPGSSILSDTKVCQIVTIDIAHENCGGNMAGKIGTFFTYEFSNLENPKAEIVNHWSKSL